jgi:zinc protease
MEFILTPNSINMKIILSFLLAAFIVQFATGQELDRSKRPKSGPAPTISVADPAIFKLPNGITIIVVENHKLPKVSATLNIDAGPVAEGSKAGTLTLLTAMLNEGTISKNKVNYDQAIDQMGADIRLNASGGSVSTLTRYFEPAFNLMAEALRQPAFPEASFDKMKGQMLIGQKSMQRSAGEISRRVINALLYGEDSPLGEFESEKSLSSVTLDDVKNAYTKYITPSRAYLTFVGDITPAKARALSTELLGDWKGAELKLPVIKKASNPAKTEIDLVDLPSAVQAEIAVCSLIELPLGSPDYHAVILANQILGGSGDGKLFRNLREQHGFTYGAYSSLNSSRFQSKFIATAAVRNEKVDSAVVEILKEIKVMNSELVSPEALQNAKKMYNGSFALGMENPSRGATYASNILINNLPKDFYRMYLLKLNAVTAQDILRVSKKYFNYQHSRVVIVGKKGVFFQKIKGLGYPVRSFDIFANEMTN